MGVKLGFSIGYNSFGYGLVIPHYGTIVVGGSNRIGNYAVLHTSTCITDTNKKIGDGLYLSSGSIITSAQLLGENITTGANAVVNHSFEEGNMLIVGAPAQKKKKSCAWYIRDCREDRVYEIERMRKELRIE